MGSIYKITNTVNGKSYIGKSKHDAEKTRINKHLNGKGNQVLKDAVAKYSKDVFTYEILHDGIIPEFLDMLEREEIAKHNTVAPNGYNLTDGGEGGSHCEETCQKISDALKGENHPMYGKPAWNRGNPWPEETCQKISNALKGKKLGTRSEEHCQKLSDALKGEKNPMYGRTGEKSPNYGKPCTEETRQKLSDALKGEKNPNYGKPLPEETRQKLSDALSGEKNPMYGKPVSKETRQKLSDANKGKILSEETKRKMSEANETPERTAARKIFFSLPSEMSLKVKRKHLRQRFPDKHSGTIHKWCQKFDSET